MAPTLSGEHYILRPFNRDDLPRFTLYRCHPDVARYQSWSDYTLADAEQLFNGMDYTSFGTEGAWYQLAIEQRVTGEMAGDVAIHFIDSQQAEIGFTVAPSFQNKGVARAAINLLTAYLFNTLQLHRIIAVTDARNRPACRLLERSAFRREGHFLKNIFFKGEWADEYLYAKLQEEHNKEVIV